MKKTILLITIIFSPIFCNIAYGCCCPTIGGTPEQIKAARLEDFNKAVAVFSGEVIELEYNKVKFKVDKIWKGKLVDEIVMVIRLKKEDGKYYRTSCDYEYQMNEKFLVYAYGTEDELTTYQCTRTTSFKHKELAEQEIKGLDEINLPVLRNNALPTNNKSK